jgi:hypothetical protein
MWCVLLLEGQQGGRLAITVLASGVTSQQRRSASRLGEQPRGEGSQVGDCEVERVRRCGNAFAGALHESGAQPVGYRGAEVPGVGGDHKRPARVERQPSSASRYTAGSGL